MAEEHQIFEWKGRLGPFDLLLSEQTFPPSSVSLLLGEALRVGEGDTVIDMGCGSGVLSIIAAKLGAGRVFGVDAAPDTEEIGNLNAELHGVADRATFLRGDLFEPLPEDLKADVIIGDVSGIPDAVARVSGWFPSGKGGGPRGSELPIRMLQEARNWLTPGGRLFLPTGSLQDENAILRTARSLYGRLSELVERRFPVPGQLADTDELRQLMMEGVVNLARRGSRLLWSARVWECSPT
ncbi:MAG: 50S ribosomal protein L11 methyltransferase [Actinomycetota bacterium]|nr:50S ribosomal protein L11 methyltransferase [Actinomycetota bacterium]